MNTIKNIKNYAGLQNSHAFTGTFKEKMKILTTPPDAFER